MKTKTGKRLCLFIGCMFLIYSSFSQSQGRVVINEYMPWTSPGCGTTAEFVELLNFGPGTVDISCYILTTGQYSITIPRGTMLQPGEFYVLAGEDFIPDDCANIDSLGRGVNVDLNWNTCNCTDQPIPMTGDGLMRDGGTSNTPLVLLDPNMNVVDAVVRSSPAEPSTTLNSSPANGCSRQTFDLKAIPLIYEELGMSAGRGNSFARTTDGDCAWVKDPQQSANASNNRVGDATDIMYSFSVINAMSCDSTGGRVNIYVEHTDITSVFPMSYTIAIDRNNDGSFDLNDDYETLIDSTAPSIDVTGLPIGHYRITVASTKGCYLKTFEFAIFSCNKALPVTLEYFKFAGAGNGKHSLQWKVLDAENVETITVQKATDNYQFIKDTTLYLHGIGKKSFSVPVKSSDDYAYFRLSLAGKNGTIIYSPIIDVRRSANTNSVWPNPATDKLFIRPEAYSSSRLLYEIYDLAGRRVAKGILGRNNNQKVYTVNTSNLRQGVYYLQMQDFIKNQWPAVRFLIK